jgi:hypothetical protein
VTDRDRRREAEIQNGCQIRVQHVQLDPRTNFQLIWGYIGGYIGADWNRLLEIGVEFLRGV